MPDPTSPLSSVITVLKEAASRGELSPTAVEWSLARLSGRVRRGNPRLEGVDRPDDILRAATDVFRRRGYHHTTIDEIANELFLTKAGVYHYFASKQEILAAICERAMKMAEAAVDAASNGHADPYRQLQAVLESYAEALQSEDGLTVALLHVDEIPEAAQQDLDRRRKRLESIVQKILERGVKEGVFEVIDTHVAVFGMFGALNWMYAWYRPGGRLSGEQVRKTLVKQLMDGVTVRRRRSDNSRERRS
ncbi:MAG TPA: TetR/AcrR family transcriptional regulator [Candidatus Dormibacteraeota bacterium]